MTETGLKNTPSPRVNGERAGVRGNQPGGFHRRNERTAFPLTLTLSPETGGEGIL